MPNKNKIKGTVFEHQIKWAFQMLGFYVIRAYSSVGVADLVAVPSWNPKGNYRSLLIQAKNTKNKDYVRSFEKDHLNYLQQINSGLVIVAYKDNSKVMIRYWESGKKISFEEFLREEYGIPCKYPELIKAFKEHRRPIQLHYVDRDEKNRPLGPFQDFYSVNVWFPHVPEQYRKNHIS